MPVGWRHGDAARVHAEYRPGSTRSGGRYEIIFVLDGRTTEFEHGLRQLHRSGESFTVIGLTPPVRRSHGLMAGFDKATGQIIVTLPAYLQIEGSEIAKLVASLEDNDLVIGRRWPRVGGMFERTAPLGLPRHAALASRDLQFHDLGCGARAMRRRVLEEIHLYGDQHRFLADAGRPQGLPDPRDRSRAVAAGSPRRASTGRANIAQHPRHLHRVLPGALHQAAAAVLRHGRASPPSRRRAVDAGARVQRLVFDQALADRPALLLSSLLVVLGLQLFALGLLGELIIFTHARNLKDYQVAEIISFPKTPSMNTPEIAVMVPCLNEEVAIAKVVADFRRVLPDAVIFVYDNGSTDRTVEVARAAGAIVRSEPLKGKGNVMRRMFADIEADIYVLVDGDDTYHADSVERPDPAAGRELARHGERRARREA